ncbi:thiol-specific monooxygenase [Gaeumannomyces tritici R3-111a-1]|uniref:Thiol-specific monooxygenase n=1 Tax=Gaeumannomyces tritici (strain R3-111a-1) TaxID=644352 RepID=J3P0S6_GAET3|nr:thiol-specific monooxygenase [Gaeumannomyces tritici R3-111a-1]EJT77209.1 thiol-specific monooxygenase [Gaeumannomyces tritici R3-111a-1]
MGGHFSKTTKQDAKVNDDRPTPKDDKTSGTNGQPARPHQRHVKSVAVIGAGYSGVVTAAHLSRYGFDVRVFERSSDVGGVWRFDARVPPDPPYPNERPQTPFSDQQPPPPPSGPAADLAHAPPGPCYAGLRNNVSTMLMRSTVVPWPAGTEEFVTHDDVEAYIRSIVNAANIRPLMSFDTAVLHVGKPPGADKWTVRTRTLRRDLDAEKVAGISFDEREWAFDAVVCASGHYQEPRVPDVPGLAAWKARFPDRVGHSRAYRDAATARFEGRAVLLIGAAVSSLDIVNEAAAVAAKVYQSSRDGLFDVPAAMLPLDRGNVERVAGISRFELAPPPPSADGGGDVQQQQQQLGDQDPIPGGAVHLADGRVLRDVAQVVVATGYVTSYPYLGPRLQRPGLPPAAARRARDRDVVVAADGVVHHNLHKDISTRGGRPSRAGGWLSSGEKEDVEDPEAAGRWGKKFHSLLGLDETFTDELLAWVNPQAEAAGGRPVVGPDDAWRARYRQMQRERAWRWKAEEED